MKPYPARLLTVPGPCARPAHGLGGADQGFRNRSHFRWLTIARSPARAPAHYRFISQIMLQRLCSKRQQL